VSSLSSLDSIIWNFIKKSSKNLKNPKNPDLTSKKAELDLQDIPARPDKPPSKDSITSLHKNSSLRHIKNCISKGLCDGRLLPYKHIYKKNSALKNNSPKTIFYGRVQMSG
jgi:hypothetical protein